MIIHLKKALLLILTNQKINNNISYTDYIYFNIILFMTLFNKNNYYFLIAFIIIY